MKFNGVSMGHNDPRGTLSLAQFAESDQAKTAIGECFIALVTQEVAWSQKFVVSLSFCEPDPCMRVDHATFLTDKPLTLYASERVWTVREVEIAVRKHLETTQSWTRSVMALVQNRSHELHAALEAIPLAKAKAAIVEIYPEADGATHFNTDGSFYAFMHGNDIGRGCIYVVRQVDGQFTGGVARIDRPASAWYAKESGLKSVDARAATFFGQLALSFAAKQLQIPEDELRVLSMIGVERPMEEWFNKPGVDQFNVSGVTLGRRGSTVDSAVAVTFEGNRPLRASEV